MQGFFSKSLLLALCISASGCASITNGYRQDVTVETHKENKPFSGAECTLSNDKGSYSVITPGVVKVRRSANDLTISCAKTGEPSGKSVAYSKVANAATTGNIPFAGITGTAFDMINGSAYDYPSPITVHMGRSTLGNPG